MPRVTKTDIPFDRGSFAGLTVPKGQPVRPAGYLHNDMPVYWVLGAAYFIPRGSIYLHDAIHYGIAVTEDQTEEISHA